jgi:hypothetical protein
MVTVVEPAVVIVFDDVKVALLEMVRVVPKATVIEFTFAVEVMVQFPPRISKSFAPSLASGAPDTVYPNGKVVA